MINSDRPFHIAATLFVMVACGFIPAHGAQLTQTPGETPLGKEVMPSLSKELVPSLDGDPWEVEFALDPWLPWIDGTIIAPVSIGFDTLLRNLDFYAPVNLAVRKGRWGFDVNFLWMKVTDSIQDLRGELLSSFRIGMKIMLAEAIVYYQVAEWEGGESFLDLGAGARGVWLDLKLGITPDQAAVARLDDALRSAGVDLGNVDVPRTYRDSEGWVDPIVMLRLRQRLTDQIFFQLYGDIGGFGVNSSFTSIVEAGFGYEITKNLTAGLSFRYWYEDYEDGSFVVDVDVFGPVVWVGWKF